MDLLTRGTLWQRIRRIWAIVGLTATAIFVTWSLIAFRASSAGREAARSDASVRVVRAEGSQRFTPAAGPRAGVGLLFFPGGLVEPAAYAPIARAAAEAGFPAVIVELPRRGAFGGADDPGLFARVRAFMRDTSVAPQWVIGGHSRGAVVASEVASRRPRGFAGLVLIGTTHPRDVDLSHLRVPVTKIVGDRDGLARPAAVAANRHLLPATTKWIRIAGGNHSQFAWYGFQPGDRFAEIEREEQQAATIRAVLDLLRAVAADRVPQR